MGCDIYSHAEVRNPDTGKWGERDGHFVESDNPNRSVNPGPFDWRSYAMFAFLTGTVRNYSAIKGIVDEPRGIPKDSPSFGSDLGDDFHSHSWVTLKELLDFNYEQELEDRRECGNTVEPGQGVRTTYREFLGQDFFTELENLKTLGEPEDVRVVFWFDD